MLKNNNLELCVVDVNHMSIYSFSNSYPEVREKLQQAEEMQQKDIETWENNCKEYPNTETFENYLKQAQNKKYEILEYNEYLELEKKYYIDRPLTETTEEEFHDMLNVLPPMKWTTKNNIEMFCISEMLTGTYTSQYLHDRDNNKYYTKIVDIVDQNTWGHNYIK